MDPEYVVADEKQILHHYRTNVIPPYTEKEIEQIKKWAFVGYRFLQEHGFTTRKLVDTIDDVENLLFKDKDRTDEGRLFYRSSYMKYIKAGDRDFTKDPETACKNILERDLKKIRGEK